MSATRCQLFAMKDAGISISAVHIDKKYIIFNNGVRKKIKLFDDDNEEVNDLEDATWYEFGDEEFGFGSAPIGDLAEFQEWNQ